MRPFGAPETTLGELDAAAMEALLNVANDITLVVDGEGLVRDVASTLEELPDA
ncbi:MAG: transcriptional regulator PpsR, partial [Chitinophagaceae bacterium]|nr:transcriptional regulator PpsR [Rubrivivax sp.]